MAQTALHAVMTEAEYDAERVRLREEHGDNKDEANGLREQALAALFYRSGWTQEKLAKKEGKSQQRISETLRFGRFLSFTAMAVKSESLPKNLTERKFREYWDQTKGDERDRFKAAQRMIADNTMVSKPHNPKGYPPIIIKEFGDAKWHLLDDIAEELGDQDHAAVERSLFNMNKLGRADVEKRPHGKSVQYRIFPRDKTISLNELIEKLTPIVKGLKDEGKKNMATMSPNTVAYLAGKLQKLLDEWAE